MYICVGLSVSIHITDVQVPDELEEDIEPPGARVIHSYEISYVDNWILDSLPELQALLNTELFP